MTKTLKRTFVALVLAIFAFLPFVFAGCNEKEIEEYKTQISTLQEQNTSLQQENEDLQEQNTNYGTQVAGLQQQKTQLEQQNSSLQEQKSSLEEQNSSLQQEKSSLQEQNTSLQEQNASLQEQVDTIHSPTAQEREAFNIIESAISKLRTAGKDNMANGILNISNQFWGVELDEILDCTYYKTETQTLFESKMQVVVEDNGVLLNMSSSGQYAFFVIIFNPENNTVTEVHVTYYVSGDTPRVVLESDTMDQVTYTSGDIIEVVQQKAKEYDSLESTKTVDIILTPNDFSI